MELLAVGVRGELTPVTKVREGQSINVPSTNDRSNGRYRYCAERMNKGAERETDGQRRRRDVREANVVKEGK